MPKAAPNKPRDDILIIDDTPDNLRLLNQILSRSYKVRLAPSGSIGLTAARSAPPDLILLDIMMPQMNGFEAAAQLKADPATAEIPIIFISALDDINSKVRGFAVGGVDYITKPFQEQEVLARVKTHLALRALYRQAQAEIAERKLVEEELRKSEERFRLIVNSTEDIIFTLDRQQRHTGVYGPWVERDGLTAGFFLGKTASEIFGEMGKVHEASNLKALAGEHVVYDWAAPMSDGIRYYLTSLSPLRDADGEIVGIVGIGRNITDRKRAEDVEHRQRLLADALRETAESLNSSLNLDDIFEKILDMVHRVVPCSAMSVTWLEDEWLKFVRLRGYEPAQAQALQGGAFRVSEFATFRRLIQTRRPLLVANVKDYPEWVPLEATNWIQSHVSAPIIVGDKVAGAINLDSATPGFYNETHAGILQTFANQVAVAVRNAQLYAEMQQLTIIDPLTGLYNRRGLYNLGIREMERVKRFTRLISLLFLDIDHFKQFNDAYSYEVGDEVLCTIARLIRSQVREVDLVCRYGGEEFVVLMPEVALADATQTAERLRSVVECSRHATAAGEVSITISIGAALFNPAHLSSTGRLRTTEQQLSNLIERGGSMLHVAKQNGRNRVEAETP